MLRSAFLLAVVLIALSSSSSVMRRKLSRRQADASPCQAIDGFDCKCSYFRVTCTTDRQLQTPITISEGEKHKYQSVELVVSAQDNVNVDDRTFEPVKELYKPDADNVEFRLKFEKFTGLHLNSAGLLNRVFPDSLPSNARKHLALEIYNPEVPPHDNAHLFQGLNADSLELYALYPFKGSFQQLFDGANIKFLRLSGGDIHSNVGQSFSGTIHRLELAKQADTLSVQNFPVYPAHEMIINAFYISKFNDEHPPNYDNLGELRVHSKERIPAGAFRQYPNIHTLSVQSDQGIDSNAFQGLDRLEKLIIKETPTTADNLKNLPNVKELETNIEQLDDNLQCQLIEKLASGQAAVQAIPNGRHCTCVSAYLDSAAGRTPCEAQGCDQSSCAAIKNNYNAETRQFNAPPAILRADGSDALRQREPRIYTAPFQVAQPDQEKLNRGTPVQPQPQPDEQDDDRRPNEDGTDGWQPDQPHRPQDWNDPYSSGHESHHGGQPAGDSSDRQDGQGSQQDSNRSHQEESEPGSRAPSGERDDRKPGEGSSDTRDDQQPQQDSNRPYQGQPGAGDSASSDDKDNPDSFSGWNSDQSRGGSSNTNVDNEHQQGSHGGQSESSSSGGGSSDTNVGDEHQHDSHREQPGPSATGDEARDDSQNDPPTNNESSSHDQHTGHEGHGHDGSEHPIGPGGDDNQPSGDGNVNQPTDDQQGADGGATAGTDTGAPGKRKMSWLPIIIIIAAIVALLLIGLIFLLLRKRRGNNAGYAKPGSAEGRPDTAARA